MGLLINLQDGNVTTVTPIAADEEVVIGTPVDEEGNPPDERVETEYNFSFDESKGSSRSGTVPQSISITTRTVTRESRSDITSESEDWNYDAVGPTRSPSSSASGMGSKSSSRSKIPSHSSSKSKPRSPASYKSKSPGSSPSSRTKSSNTLSKSKSGSGSASVTGSELSGLLPPDDPRDLDVESDRYSEAASGSVTRSERELARARQSRERERSNLELLSRASGGEFDETVSRREEGDYEVVTTERCATFPRHRGSPSPPSSPHSSISIRKGMSPPKTPRSRSPKSPRAEPEPNRILLDTLSFSFNTPQPYTDNWEWVGECSGLKADRHRFEGERKKIPPLTISSTHSSQLLPARTMTYTYNAESSMKCLKPRKNNLQKCHARPLDACFTSARSELKRGTRIVIIFSFNPHVHNFSRRTHEATRETTSIQRNC